MPLIIDIFYYGLHMEGVSRIFLSPAAFKWGRLLDTLDHLGVDQRVISLLIESNRPRACFGERRQREI